MSVTVNNDRPRVAGGGERPVLVAVGVDRGLHRRTLDDAVLGVRAHERLDPSGAANSDTGRLPVLDDEKTRLAVNIELRRTAYSFFLDDALDLQEAADRVFEGGLALGMRVHLQDEISRRDLVA